MTHLWPASRNSFHPAWLLLLVPPAISWGIAWLSDSDRSVLLPLGRLTLMALVVLPWVWWRSTDAGPGLRRILKEVRLQLPGFLIAVGLPGVLGIGIHPDLAQWVFLTFAFGCCLMGATAFGSEFEQRTLGGLLAQPRPRIAIFLEKLLVLATLLGVALAHFVLLQGNSPGFEFHVALNVVGAALCTGPLFSLWSRSTLAGLIFSVTAPLLLYLLASLLGEWVLQRWAPGELTEPEFEQGLFRVGLPLYLLASLVLAWRTFLNLELRDGEAGGKAASNLHPLSGPVDRLIHPLLGRAGSWGPLLRKEFRLQVIPWLVASLAVGVWLLWMAVSWARGGEIDPRAVDQVSGATLVAGLMSLMLILGTSAASVAEERELGTLEWQLTQPVPIRRQWWAKVMVTTLFTFAMGLALPYLLLRLWFGPSTLMEGWNHPGPRDLLVVVACTGILQALGMYASSLSRNTMKASALTVGLAAGLVLLVALCGWTLERHMEATLGGFQEGSGFRATIHAPAWAPTAAELTQYLQLAVGGAVLLLVATLLALASSHFRQTRPAARRLTLEWAGLSVGLMAVLLVGGGVFTRLALLNHQSRMAEFQSERRAALVQELARSDRATTLTQTLREKFGVSPGASNEELCQAIVERAGPGAVEEIWSLLVHLRGTGAKNTEYLNQIAARYGLPLIPPSTNPPATPPLRPPRQDR